MIVSLLHCRQGEETLFTHLAPSDTGVTFVNKLEESADFNVLKYGYFYNGGGVAVGDLNNDGIPDLYFSGNLVPNQLYFGQEQGQIRYRLAPEGAGISAADGWNTGVSLVDINSDGYLDIYQCRSAATSPRLRRNLLFVNNGNETFTERAADYGLDDAAYSTQAVFFDYDRDGDVDCFVLNHSVQQYAGFSAANGQLKNTPGPQYASKLYRNDGPDGFVNVSALAGLHDNVLGFGLSVAVSDFDGDGWPDLYVCNDYHEQDYYYRNRGDGTFSSELAAAFDYVSLFSMGSDAADLNNDGRTDLITLDMLPHGNERIKLTAGADNYQKFRALIDRGFYRQYSRNMLQLNQGDGTFAEVGQQWGLSNTDWSWAVLAGDLDLDGHKDVYITNGYARDYTNMQFLTYTMAVQTKSRVDGTAVDQLEVIANMPAIDVANYVFAGRADSGFVDRSAAWGFTENSLSNGAVLADLDRDGDLDIVVSNVNSPAAIYQNGTKGAAGITVDLTQAPPALAIGARVTVTADSSVQVQEFYPARGFQSSAYVPLVFGLGGAAGAKQVDVEWTDGRRDRFTDVTAGERLELWGPDTVTPPATETDRMLPPAVRIDTFPFVHREDVRNDFDLQRLLPFMLSYGGPALATSVAGEYLFFGGARGQASEVFRLAGGEYVSSGSAAFAATADCEDTAAAFADLDEDGDADLIVASAGYELEPGDKRLRPRLYHNDRGSFHPAKDVLPAGLSLSASVVLAWDVDGDGDQDLFFGSRVVPGEYPLGGTSYLLLNDGAGRFLEATALEVGMVTDALALDVDADGDEDLVVSRHFGTVVALLNEGGTFEVGRTLDLSPTGLWNTLYAVDLDGDGRQEVIAGNLGTNNQFSAVGERPLVLYHGRFFGAGQRIPLLAYTQDGREYPFAARDELMEILPGLKKRYPDYLTYSTATVQEVLGEALGESERLEAAELRSMVLHPSAAPRWQALPMEAQRAPIFAVSALDATSDGQQEVIFGGNLLHTRVRIGQLSANHGQAYTVGANGQLGYRFDIGLRGEVRNLVSVPGGRVVAGVNDGAARVIGGHKPGVE
ncbi:VCBS repeat-containing protein [Neolewinella sp.]|uniref:VCBS repeat-containing protein n=1 Tax=Neolewinella sp. TaxID=2993543 RepID=UPI003B518C87